MTTNGSSVLFPISFHTDTDVKAYSSKPVSAYFGEMTFGLNEMRARLASDVFKSLQQTLDQGKKLPRETAEAIALAVKDWAVSKGVSHYCHWFQPMTGASAEKHDAFISTQSGEFNEVRVIERFSGGQLIQGEPDASSFPSGGVRSTFEARGYTAWDPTSPLFIVDGKFGKTLCIPSIFFGYDGISLDFKTPLLRSSQALSQAAVKFLKLLGDVDVKRITATLGAEQEYFLVDSDYAAKRPDLIMAGKTLLGAPSSKGQQLEDHYFGAVPQRVKTMWEEVEIELFRLGIPVKTRHNEVAPAQFEMAPIFEDANIACDHNTLAMEIMKKVAKKHGFMLLFNEKPFKGLNGSGKHCNWSIRNDKGENLLEPGKTPHQNLRFLAMCAVTYSAVYKHAGALRASIATPGNDARLGGNEAPPPIISVFLGSHLEKIFEHLIAAKPMEAVEARFIRNLGVEEVPEIKKDHTDRNRTSPFAFTGNKFEFRAVGASANCAWPMTILNAAVADMFGHAAERLQSLLREHTDRDAAVTALIRELAINAKPILFSGNNYSEEWKVEAKKRGLPIHQTTADAIEVFKDVEATKFLSTTGVLSEDEVRSRYNIMLDRYCITNEIELSILKEMVQQHSLPAIEKQLQRSHAILAGAQTEALKTSLKKRTTELETVFAETLTQLATFEEIITKAHKIEDHSERCTFIAREATPAAEKLRTAADRIEYMVADEYWELPRYRDMLFSNVVR